MPRDGMIDVMNAVAAAEGPLLVLGGPGTGKTSLLVDAAAQRLRAGDPPALIFAASRQAASELRDAIVRACGQTMLAPRVLTIHAFCLELVRAFGHDDDAPPQLLTAPEQEFRIRELLAGWAGEWPAELGEAVATRAFAAQVRAVLARARQLGLDPADVAAHGRSAGERGWADVGAFMAEYLDVLDAEARLDYAELVHRARLLLHQPDVREAVLRGVGAVYVDEWCELDPAQIALLRSLVPDGFPIVALADPDTAIFSFRGAHPRAAAEFVRLFTTPTAPVGVEVLTTAWRQPPALVEALGSVRRRLGAPALEGAEPARAYRAVQAGGTGGGVGVWTFPDEATQARALAGELRSAHLEHGLAWGEMAVLVRSGRRQIPALARALADAGIPVEVAGDEIGLAAELAVRPLLLALEVAGAGGVPDADEAHRLLLSGWGGFDAVSIRRLGRRLRAEDPAAVTVPAETLIAEALGGLREVPADDESLALRRDLLADASRVVAAGGRPDEALWQLWDGTHWPAALREEALRGQDSAPRAHRDLDAVTALFRLAHESLAPPGAEGVRWFLAEVAQQQIPADSQREAAVAGRGVRVLTAHRAKGHQWPFVVVAGVQEGVWPDIARRGSVFDPLRLSSAGLGEGVQTRELVASERRLFLLACSRASGRLLVTAVEGTEGEEDRPSRFLPELGRAIRRVEVPEPRLTTLRALVAELRRVLQDPATSPRLRAAAAQRLARLADADAADQPWLVPDADPQRWWGMREPTSWAAPARGTLTLSPSQLESILRCPRQYFLQREARADPPRGSATILGSVIHAVAERAATGELSAASADALLDEVWSGIPFPAAWLSASERAEADAAVARFLTWQASHEHADVLGVEVPFSVDVDVAGRPVTLRGTVDRLERTPQGQLRVIDFKTGRRAPSSAEARALPQIGVYQLAIEAGGFADVAPGAGSAGASLVYLRLDSTEGYPKELRQPSLTEAPHLSEDPDELAHPTWVHHRVAQARDVLVRGDFEARPGAHCQYCPVRNSCPARSGQVV